ncbi:MAG: hypothetical protein NG737_04585 [Omnitrophica bacterium]|nr:hypothetical protein [Candidatus Omnitrophota bacterium]
MEVTKQKVKKYHSRPAKKNNNMLLGSSIIGLSGFNLCKMYDKRIEAAKFKNKALKKSILFI